jgi:hypothetical protein
MIGGLSPAREVTLCAGAPTRTQPSTMQVQNVPLGKVVGRIVPFRQPQDPTLLRISLRHGHLETVDGG